MRVFLLNPPYVEGYCVARWESVSISKSHWYPIFLSYCTGLLEKHGHNCLLLDAQAESLSFNDCLKLAKKFSPDFTVVKPTLSAIKHHVKLANRIKDVTNSKIIFVGPWCSLLDKKIKNNDIDYIVKGEFDFIVKEIVEGRKGKGVIKAGRITQEELDALPWVTKVYDKFLNKNNYNIASLYHPFVDMFVESRKCYWAEKSGGCTFCLYPNTILEGKSKAVRDIEDVLDEIEFVSKNIKVKDIFFQDGTPSSKRLEKISDGIIRRGIDVSWGTYARADLSLKPHILKKMRKSGCHLLHVGCESFSDKILKNVNKGINTKILERSIKNINKANIDIHGDFIIGLPEETRETIKNTINWAKKQPIMFYQFSIPKPYPRTPYYEWLKKNNYLKNNKPNYPGLSFKEMEKLAKEAMKECYFNFYYIRKLLKRPAFFTRILFDGINTIPWMIWRKWKKQ